MRERERERERQRKKERERKREREREKEREKEREGEYEEKAYVQPNNLSKTRVHPSQAVRGMASNSADEKNRRCRERNGVKRDKVRPIEGERDKVNEKEREREIK